MKETDIYRQIDLYFESQLSAKEEEDLFRFLLSFGGSDPKVDEALAVMLMTRRPTVLSSSSQRPSVKTHFWRVAAAVAFIAVTVATILWHNTHSTCESEVMMAYVGGVKVSDQSEIMKIVEDQLNDIGQSSELFAQTIADDLDDIRDAFNEEGI